MQGLRIEWSAGGDAQVVSFKGEQAEVSSSISGAPGSTLVGDIEGLEGPVFRLKVKRCQKQSDGRFLIRGRLVNLVRPLRAHLEAAQG